MAPQWLIEKKRDGGTLSAEDIGFLIEGYTAGDIPDYQMAALAMAIYFQGMNLEETTALTHAMMTSGDLVDTSGIGRPKVDKHSSGGIGDKVSLVLAPLLAACDLAVPMVSGWGLGITGGTLDKLAAIPGYRTDLDEAEFLHIVDTCGCAITGPTGRLAPADKKLYALRGVTGTVPSIPLITASIMCKKLAEGIDHLVLDVKCGKGTFMKDLTSARTLAETMVEVGTRMDKRVTALITGMDEPLGRAVGNAVEVRESIECLRGRGPADLMEVTLALGARLLVSAEKARDQTAALTLCRETIESGRALNKFRQMVALQGGDVSCIDHPQKLPAARVRKELRAERGGFVAEVDADLVGRACLVLGAGRTKTDGAIDHAVGFTDLKKRGEAVREGEPLAVIHANEKPQQVEPRLAEPRLAEPRMAESRMAQAERMLKNAIRIGPDAPRITSRIIETLLPKDATV